MAIVLDVCFIVSGRRTLLAGSTIQYEPSVAYQKHVQ